MVTFREGRLSLTKVTSEIALSDCYGRTLCKGRLQQGLCVLEAPLSGQNGQATRDRTDDREGERLWMLGAVLTRATSGHLRRGRRKLGLAC